jgi:methylphosphotriester-DNA--protein-cysteine methyltransferase
MRPLNVKKLQNNITALSSELAGLEQKRNEALARRPGLLVSERPKFFKEVTGLAAKTKKTERRLHVAKRLLARAQGDEYGLQLP